MFNHLNKKNLINSHTHNHIHPLGGSPSWMLPSWIFVSMVTQKKPNNRYTFFSIHGIPQNLAPAVIEFVLETVAVSGTSDS